MSPADTSVMAERYRIEVTYRPWGEHDPIPWAYAVVDGTTIIETGWAGTEAEAHVYAKEWRKRYMTGDWDFSDGGHDKR